MNSGYFGSDELKSFGIGAVGKNSYIAKTTVISGIENISIGHNVRIDDFVVVAAKSGNLTIGNYVHISSHCYLGCRGGILIDDYANISGASRLLTASDDVSGEFLIGPTVKPELTKPKVERIHLQRHALVLSDSTILPGVVISEGSVVGAKSLVRETTTPWSIYVGIPARKLRGRSRSLLDLENLNEIHHKYD